MHHRPTAAQNAVQPLMSTYEGAQVCLKQHMFRNGTVRHELMHCNLFLFVEAAGAAAGGTSQVVWSAMHPRTVTTGAPPCCALSKYACLKCRFAWVSEHVRVTLLSM